MTEHLDLVLTFALPLIVYVVLLKAERRLGARALVALLTLLLVVQFSLDLELFMTMSVFGAAAALFGYAVSPANRRPAFRKTAVSIDASPGGEVSTEINHRHVQMSTRLTGPIIGRLAKGGEMEGFEADGGRPSLPWFLAFQLIAEARGASDLVYSNLEDLVTPASRDHWDLEKLAAMVDGCGPLPRTEYLTPEWARITIVRRPDWPNAGYQGPLASDRATVVVGYAYVRFLDGLGQWGVHAVSDLELKLDDLPEAGGPAVKSQVLYS